MSDIANSGQPVNQGPLSNILEYLNSYAADPNPDVRQQFGSIFCEILKNQPLEDILTHIHELIAAILIVSEDKNPAVRTSLVEQIPHIFLQCHEHACPDLEHYLYDRLLQIVLDYLQDPASDVSRDAYLELQILLDKYVLDKKRIEEKVCPAIIYPIDKIQSDIFKGFNINSIMLMGRIAPIIGPEKCEELFLDYFIKLCQCKKNNISRTCATIFPTMCYALGTKITEEKLLDIFFELCSDPFWGVRKACAESIALISLICSPECRRTRIAPVVSQLCKDTNNWVVSSTFKILGQFISSFAQPCITGLAYSYNGELLITNPVDSDFRDHSDPETVANYEHYLKMFSTNSTTDSGVNNETSSANTQETNKLNNHNTTSNKIISNDPLNDDNLTASNIAEKIIENKNQLAEQVNGYQWPKEQYPNLLYITYPKHSEFEMGRNSISNNINNINNNITDNTNDDRSDPVEKFKKLFKEWNTQNFINDNTTNSDNNSSQVELTSNLMKSEPVYNLTTVMDTEQITDQQKQTQLSNVQNENSDTLQQNASDSSFNELFDIIENLGYTVQSSMNLQNTGSGARRRVRQKLFFRKNTPTDLQSIIKKAISDAEGNVKPPLPPPPPHPLKSSAAPSTLSTTNLTPLEVPPTPSTQDIPPSNIKSINIEQPKFNISNNGANESNLKNNNSHEKATENEKLSCTETKNNNDVTATPTTPSLSQQETNDNSIPILTFWSDTSDFSSNDDNEKSFSNITEKSSNNSGQLSNISNTTTINKNITLDNLSNLDNQLDSRLNNLSDIKDKNGNDNNNTIVDDEDAFNSYQFWHIKPEMPLDSNIIGNLLTDNYSGSNSRRGISSNAGDNGGNDDNNDDNYFGEDKSKKPILSKLFQLRKNNNLLSSTDNSIKYNINDEFLSSSTTTNIHQKKIKSFPPNTFEQNIVPPEILEAYVTMVFYEGDNEIKLTCAYNFPAVVLTLGKSNWHILKSLLQYLCDEIDWKIRKTIALSINFLALILGKEIATRDLLPIYLSFFKDVDEVKVEAIRNFSSFLKAIESSKHEEVLSKIGFCLCCDSHTNWRIKEDLAKEICLIIKMNNLMNNSKGILLNLAGLSGYLLEDKVSCVREIAADAMAEIILISSRKYKEAIVSYFLIEEFSRSTRWRNRQIFLNVIYKYNLLLFSKNDSLNDKQSSTTMSEDDHQQKLEGRSSNSIEDALYIFDLVFRCIQRLTYDMVPNIRLLVAKYLVLLICNNVIKQLEKNESQYENVIVLVRRLRNDEDRDVKETFESIDLLKDEFDERDYLIDENDEQQQEPKLPQQEQVEKQNNEQQNTSVTIMKDENKQQTVIVYSSNNTEQKSSELSAVTANNKKPLTYSAILRSNLIDENKISSNSWTSSSAIPDDLTKNLEINNSTIMETTASTTLTTTVSSTKENEESYTVFGNF